MDRNGISQSVVFPSVMIPHTQRQANEETLSMVAGKDRFIPFAFIDPRLDESPSLLEELLQKGCKGLKLHPVCHGYVVSHGMCSPSFEVAQAHDLPVIIHSGWGEYGEIRFIAQLAEQYKQLKIIVGHMKEYQDIFALLPRYDNVAVETSYATHPRRIAQAVNALGSERVLFGSDFPCGQQDFELYKVLHAPLAESEKENVLYKNAERMLQNKR